MRAKCSKFLRKGTLKVKWKGVLHSLGVIIHLVSDLNMQWTTPIKLDFDQLSSLRNRFLSLTMYPVKGSKGPVKIGCRTRN
jgi:hypothetical protein